MKLRNKLLTVLPLSVIGLATPIAISSCSCSTKTITINFGDGINCLNKNVSNPSYHERKVVKDSLWNRVQVEEEALPTNQHFRTADGKINQQFYWDLVFSASYYGITFILTGDWSKADGEFTGKFQGNNLNLEFTSLEYKKDTDNQWKIWSVKSGEESKALTRSYTYHLNKN